MRLGDLLTTGAGANCRREEEILTAYRQGVDGDTGSGDTVRGDAGDNLSREEAERHLASCESCRRAVRVSSALAVLAAEGPGFPLPEPHQVLWRARILRRFAARDAATERAARPLAWAGAAAALVATAVLVALVTMGYFEGLASIDGLTSVSGWLPTDGASLATAIRSTAWLGIGLVAAAVALATRVIFQEG